MILPFPHQQPEEERNAEKRGQNPDGYDLRRANVSGEHIGKGDKGRPKQRRTGNQEAVFGTKGKTCDMRGNQSDKTDERVRKWVGQLKTEFEKGAPSSDEEFNC